MGATCGSETGSGPELNYGTFDVDALRQKFEQAGQGHVFNGFGDMDEGEKEQFIRQCNMFDVNQINQLFENLVTRPQQTS